MILTVGGKSQGKLDFILEKYNLSLSDVADGQLLQDKKVIYNLQDFIMNCLEKGQDPYALTENFIKENTDKIFICNEVGYGIVPIEKIQRQYRDSVGKICCLIAKNSSKVYRVVCGVPQVIKDA